MIKTMLLSYWLINSLTFISCEVNLLIKYPVKLLPPVNGQSFSGLVDKKNLHCFSNQDYPSATFLEGLYCIGGLTRLYKLYSCSSLWGRRSVSVQVNGSVEFFRTNKLPREESSEALNVTHWLYLNSPNNSISHEIKHVEADPFYLCVRCNDWKDSAIANFSLKIRPAYTRDRARNICMKKMIFGGLYLIGLSMSWLSPLLKASWAAIYMFKNGLHVFILLVTISIVTVLFTPFILTKKNRSYVRSAYKLFFSTVKSYPLPQDELEQDYRQAWLLFHAFYFSCILVCIGCTATYVSFIYFGYNREIRNDLLRISLSVAATAFIYFTSRMFEVWSNRIATVALTVSIVSSVRQNINPGSKNEVTVAVIFYSLLLQVIIKRVSSLPRFIQISEMFYREMNSLQVDLLGRVFSGGSFSKSISKRKSSHSLIKLPSHENIHHAIITQSTPSALSLVDSKKRVVEQSSSQFKSLSIEMKIHLIGPITIQSTVIYIPSLALPSNSPCLPLLLNSIQSSVWYSHQLNNSSNESSSTSSTSPEMAILSPTDSSEDINDGDNDLTADDNSESEERSVIQLTIQLNSSKNLQTLIQEFNFMNNTSSSQKQQQHTQSQMWRDTCQSYCQKNDIKLFETLLTNLHSNLSLHLHIVTSSLNSSAQKNNQRKVQEIIESVSNCFPCLTVTSFSLSTHLSTNLPREQQILSTSSLTSKSFPTEISFPIGLTCQLSSSSLPSFSNLIKEHHFLTLNQTSTTSEWRSEMMFDFMNVVYSLQLPSSITQQFIQLITQHSHEISFHLEKDNLVTVVWSSFDCHLSSIFSSLSLQDKLLFQQNLSSLLSPSKLSSSSSTSSSTTTNNQTTAKKKSEQKEDEEELSVEIWCSYCFYSLILLSYLSYLSKSLSSN